MKGFRVTRADRAASPVEVGQAVYPCLGWDYGCANEDTRRLGLAYTSVTLDPTGAYPFFTIPVADLEELPDDPAAEAASPESGSTGVWPDQSPTPLSKTEVQS